MASGPNLPKRNRTAQIEKHIDDSVKVVDAAINTYGPTPTGPVLPCTSIPAYGSGSEVANFTIVQAIKAIPVANRTRPEKKAVNNASEEVGERAGLVALKERVEAQGRTFNPDGVQTFNASGVFNMVYIDPPPPPGPLPATYDPDLVIVVECKGGESQCGSRKRKSTGAIVTQGTLPYCEDIAQTMATSNYRKKSKKQSDVDERAKRRKTGTIVEKALASGKGACMVVRGSYTDTTLLLPEIIHAVPM